MVVVTTVGACAFRIRVEVDANVERAEAARLFVAFTDRLELGFQVEVFDVGKVATSEAAHARDTSRAVCEPLAHARTGRNGKIGVVVELRIDRARVGHVEVAAKLAGGTGGIRSIGWVVRQARLRETIGKPGAGSRWWIGGAECWMGCIADAGGGRAGAGDGEAA